MPSTRSLTRSLNQNVALAAPATPIRKRKSVTDAVSTSPSGTSQKRAKAASASNTTGGARLPTPPSPTPVVTTGITSTSEDFIPAKLTFDLDAAKAHLVKADSRFEKLFANIKCRPFEELEVVKPFRTLCSSILGQQISWKAARSIKHKFMRLFDTSLPEACPPPHEKQIDFFPTPAQVAASSIADLRTAGLSARKAEYVIDLATRFTDGRLSASKLANGTEEEVSQMLLDVKGIGPWTVHMFSIFSLRLPDVLPAGDLGVQKGLLRWVIASHSPEDAKKIKIAAFRLPGAGENEDITTNTPAQVPPTPSGEESQGVEAESDAAIGGPSSSLLPAPNNPLNPPATPMKMMPVRKSDPPPFTPSPSILGTVANPIPLPNGLTLAGLKARLGGKKIKKGLYFTPEEMDHLTASWAPYRSIGVWYLWSVVDGEA